MWRIYAKLQDQTWLGTQLPSVGGGMACGDLKDLADTFACTGRALEVHLGTDLFADFLALFGGDRSLIGFVQLLNSLRVVAQIFLQANQDMGHIRVKMERLVNPLLPDVMEGVGRVDGKTYQNHVRVGI